MGLQQSWKLDQKLVSSMVWHYDATMRDFNYTPTRLLDSLCRHLCFLLIQNEVESRVLSMSCYTRNQHTWCTKRRKFYYKQLKSSDRSTEQKLTMSKSVKKLVEETKEQGYTELELCDKSLSSIADIPGLSKCTGHSWKQKKLEERIHVLFESNFVMFRPCIFAYFSYKLSFSPAEAFGTAYVKSQQNNMWVNFF